MGHCLDLTRPTHTHSKKELSVTAQHSDDHRSANPAAGASLANLAGAIHAFVMPGVAFQLMPVIVGAVKDGLGLATGQLGTIPSAELGAMTLANLLGAWLIRGGSWRRLLWAGWLLLIFGNLASAAAHSATSLLACRAVAGFGGGLLSAVAAAALARAANPERAFAASSVAQAILAAACMAVAPKLLQFASWGILFITVAVLALPGLALIGRIAALHSSADHGPERARRPGERINARILWGPMGMFLGYLAMSMVWVYMGEVGQQAGLSIEAVALGLSAGTLASLAGSLFVTAVGQKLPRVAALSMTPLLTCAALSIVFATSVDWVFVLGVILWSFGATMFTPYAFATTAHADPSGTATSLASALTGAGAATGPMLAGYFVSGSGLGSVAWLAAGFLLAAWAVLASLTLRTRSLNVDAARTSA